MSTSISYPRSVLDVSWTFYLETNHTHPPSLHHCHYRQCHQQGRKWNQNPAARLLKLDLASFACSRRNTNRIATNSEPINIIRVGDLARKRFADPIFSREIDVMPLREIFWKLLLLRLLNEDVAEYGDGPNRSNQCHHASAAAYYSGLTASYQ